MISAFVALGANLGDPKAQIGRAVAALRQLPNSRFIACSPLYGSIPMGPSDQPDYVNGVAWLETDLTAHELLDQTQRIELEHGRVRKAERWGPRTLDLDLLCFDDRVCSEPVVLPRAEILHNAFVLCPFAELAPDWIHPVAGLCLSSLWRQYDKSSQPLTAVTLVASGCEFGQ